MRKRLDFSRPLALSVIEECLQIAIQGPSCSNSQGWHFLVVTDADKKAAIASCYQKSFADYEAGPAQPTKLYADDPSMTDIQQRALSSAQYLAVTMARTRGLRRR